MSPRHALCAACKGYMPLRRYTISTHLPVLMIFGATSLMGHSRRSDGQQGFADVRYAFNGDRICASQQTDAMCHVWTGAPGDRREVDGASPSR